MEAKTKGNKSPNVAGDHEVEDTAHQAQEADTDHRGQPDNQARDGNNASRSSHTAIEIPEAPLRSNESRLRGLLERLRGLRLSNHSSLEGSQETGNQVNPLRSIDSLPWQYSSVPTRGLASGWPNVPSNSRGLQVQPRLSPDLTVPAYVPTLRGGKGKKRKKIARRNRRSVQFTPSSSSSSSSSRPSSPVKPAPAPPTPPPEPEPELAQAGPATPNHNFSRVHPHKSSLDINIMIREKLLTRLSDYERQQDTGYIYGFTFPAYHHINGAAHPSFPHPQPSPAGSPACHISSFVKIGCTGQTISKRMGQIEHICGYRPVPLFRNGNSATPPDDAAGAYRMPIFRRFEIIIHQQLRNHQLKEITGGRGCLGCDRKHQEWFAVSPAEAERVVRTWARWAGTRPYAARDGRLLPMWRQQLQALGPEELRDARCWDRFVWGDEEEESSAQGAGAEEEGGGEDENEVGGSDTSSEVEAEGSSDD
jgi:hypothetical protein